MGRARLAMPGRRRFPVENDIAIRVEIDLREQDALRVAECLAVYLRTAGDKNLC